jgi:hypothetical protein
MDATPWRSIENVGAAGCDRLHIAKNFFEPTYSKPLQRSRLELALRKGYPLTTLDAALSIAARSEKVPLIGDGRK